MNNSKTTATIKATNTITTTTNTTAFATTTTTTTTINPFPHDKILNETKLKAFADDKLNITEMIISVFDRVENIVGKGEIACTSNFSFSHNVFKEFLFKRRQKVSLYGNGLI